MNEPLCLLDLDLESLQCVRDHLRTRIEEGLARDGRQIAALPAYLPVPPIELAGRALVVDTGGTNMRAAVLCLAANGAEVVAGPHSAPVPTGRDGVTVDGDAFFAAQAELAAGLAPDADLPVGYCFSYPARILPDGDGELIRWTKGLNIAGVEGTRVGARLQDALARRGLRPGPVRVLNDTVAALMAGAWAWRMDRIDAFIGLIVGTGTNMAAFLPARRMPKLGSPSTSRMAVNLESGNFHPPHLTEWDELLDAASENENRQRFEKAVSGLYLPQVYQRILTSLTGEGAPLLDGAGALDALRRDDPSDQGILAGAVLDRSAALVAAALAGLADTFEPDSRVGVVAEGSLFWGASGYAGRVRSTLDLLLGPERVARVDTVPQANLVGSAVAALLTPIH